MGVPELVRPRDRMIAAVHNDLAESEVLLELVNALHDVTTFVWCALIRTDPETLLGSSAVVEGFEPETCVPFWDNELLDPDFLKFNQLARHHDPVATRMTPDQIGLVIGSIEQLRPRSDEFARRFYEELFALEPDARELFPEDMTQQRVKLFKELDEIAHAIPTLDAFVVRAQHLGAEHLGFGVQRRHYTAFGNVLLSVLSEILADDFTPDLAEAWRVAYNLVADSMQRGALELDR